MEPSKKTIDQMRKLAVELNLAVYKAKNDGLEDKAVFSALGSAIDAAVSMYGLSHEEVHKSMYKAAREIHGF